MKYKIIIKNTAKKDIKKIQKSNLKKTFYKLLKIVQQDPYQNPPYMEKLMGDLKGCYSRRINKQHRLVYEVNELQKTVRILSVWSHYGDN